MTARRRPQFELWFAFCALLGLAVIGLFAWAVIHLVTHYT